ncbi:hypothetical protein CRYUN_Cryun16bG0043000 [Craigia yunnanensis]
MTDGLLQNLVTLTLSHCTKCTTLSVGQLSCLRQLHIKGMQELEEWPEVQCPSLGRLHISNCPKLREVPKLMPNLRVLKIKKCGSLKALPMAPSLMFLILIDNLVLKDWQEVGKCITRDDQGNQVVQLRPTLIGLLELKMEKCPNIELPQVFAPQKLEISGCEMTTALPVPQFAQRLQHLALETCSNGTLVRAIPSTNSLYSLVISNISNLTSFPKLPHLPGLKSLYISDCESLASLSEEEGSLKSLSSLKLLSIRGCPKLESFPDEGLPTALECLMICSCPILKSLGSKQTLKSLLSLKDLYLEDCPLIQSFPEDGLPSSLLHLEIHGCHLLIEQCQKEAAEGTEWPKIMHVRDQEIDSIKLPSAPDVPKKKKWLPLIGRSKGIVVIEAYGHLVEFVQFLFPLHRSLIEVKNGSTFLDLIVNQVQSLNSKYRCNIPLVLMNSSRTHDDILKVLEKHSSSKIDIHPFRQNNWIYVGEQTQQELSVSEGGEDKWYVYFSTSESLLKYILCPLLDILEILNHLAQNNIEYWMEVTPTTSTGLMNFMAGSLQGKFKASDILNCPDLEDFTSNPTQSSVKKFKFIDTRNLWIDLKAIKRLVDTSALKLNDLSTLKISDFKSRFKTIPSIIRLDILEVTDDVWFGADITLKGRVIIGAKPGVKLQIPDGVVLKDEGKFETDGTVVPVTVVDFREGNIVTQVKNSATDGYDDVQAGYKRVRDKKLTKPELGHLEKGGVIPMRHLQEFRLQTVEEFEVGHKLAVEEIFKVILLMSPGLLLGKDFKIVIEVVFMPSVCHTGGIKRHNFKSGQMTHGSKSHRALGCMGAGTTPGHVYKRKKMPGRMGGSKRKTQKLKIVKIDNELRVVMIKGAVPGKPGNLLRITPAKIVGKNIPKN